MTTIYSQQGKIMTNKSIILPTQIINFSVFALVALLYIFPCQTFARAVEVKFGSEEYWKDAAMLQKTYGEILKTTEPGTKRYAEVSLLLKRLSNEKCFVGQMMGLDEDSPDYKKLFQQLRDASEKYRMDVKNLK